MNGVYGKLLQIFQSLRVKIIISGIKSVKNTYPHYHQIIYVNFPLRVIAQGLLCKAVRKAQRQFLRHKKMLMNGSLLWATIFLLNVIILQ